MKLLTILAVALVCCCSVRAQCGPSTPPGYTHVGQTYMADTPGMADVTAAGAALAATGLPGTVIVPTGNCQWVGYPTAGATVTTTFTASVTIQGQGAQQSTSYNASLLPAQPNSVTGTDSTTFIDNNTTNGNPLWVINETSAGAIVRWTGIQTGETSTTHNQSSGMIQFGGVWTAQLRVDHSHWGPINSGDSGFQINGPVIGVADHNWFDVGPTGNIATNDVRFYNGNAIAGQNGWNGQSDPNALADPSWADSERWGTQYFFFIEDSVFSNGYWGDCVYGGRGVIRYSSATGTQGLAQHGTTSNYRGCRAIETNNVWFSSNNPAGGSILHPNSGGILAWGITTEGNNVKNIVGTAMERIRGNEGRDAEEIAPAPTNWGYCGTQFYTGTATTTASSTSISGTGFQTNTPTIFNMYIPGAQCPGVYADLGSVCSVSSVANSTSATLAGAATVGVSGVTYTVGSPWDDGANLTGYPCLDSPARGKGDLLNGLNLPSRLNTVTSTTAWPHQALSPIYLWHNTLGSSGTQTLLADTTGTLAQNRDYYFQYGAYQSGSNCTTSPCNITAGINDTNRAPVNGTDLCTAGTDLGGGSSTPGVGWWDTTLTNPNDAAHPGGLYVCTAPNTWTLYYQPYTYPHPLTVGMTLTPSPENFGTVNVGSSSSPVTFTLTNNSASSATSISPSVSGGNSADFGITNSGAGSCSAAGGTLTASTSCTFTVTFTPGAAGSRSTTLSVSYSGGDGAGQQTAALSGTGGQITISPSSQNFGSVNVGSSSSPVTFTLTNNSAASATSITPVTTGGSAGDFVITNSGAGSCAAVGSLAPTASCTFTVKFSPSAAGARSTTLSVSYSGGDGASPQTAALSGTGTGSSSPITAPCVVCISGAAMESGQAQTSGGN